MAYVSQEFKSSVQPQIQAILKRYGIKGTLAVEHHSTLVLNIREGEIDFISNYNQTVAARPGGHRLGAPARDSLDVNTHWYHEQFSGRAKQFLEEVMAAMKGPKYFDHSDLQSDYHHCSHYYDVRIGRWNKPYQLAA